MNFTGHQVWHTHNNVLRLELKEWQQMVGYQAFQREPVEFRCRVQRSEWTVGAENSCVEDVEFWVAGELSLGSFGEHFVIRGLPYLFASSRSHARSSREHCSDQSAKSSRIRSAAVSSQATARSNGRAGERTAKDRAAPPTGPIESDPARNASRLRQRVAVR